MDRDTAAGDSPERCASDIFKSILTEDNEDIPIQYFLIAWLRSTLPPIYHYLMERRARSLANNNRSTQFV